jgi:hypothetical protein
MTLVELVVWVLVVTHRKVMLEMVEVSVRVFRNHLVWGTMRGLTDSLHRVSCF